MKISKKLTATLNIQDTESLEEAEIHKFVMVHHPIFDSNLVNIMGKSQTFSVTILSQCSGYL